MKVVGLIALGLCIAGCVQADEPYKFKSEKVAYLNYSVYRTVDTELNVACYASYSSISCVKL
ncbi:hypothetical protein D9M71_637970 [compost metagenome]